MRIYVDHAKIERRARLGQILIGAGLASFVIGLIISFVRPEQIPVVLATALIGLVLSQGGNVVFSRWGRSPRMDQVIDDALKGLNDNYALIHYAFGADHFMVSPAGVFLISPRPEEGEITFENGEWWQEVPKRGLLRRGGRRSLGDLGKRAARDARKLTHRLEKATPELEGVDLEPILLFVHEDAEVRVEDAPLPCVHFKKIKGWIRKQPRGASLSQDQQERLVEEAGLQS
jgi:hypothetical protein